ncbi:MAG TPA: hypothetical protein VFS59_14760, partial [Gemmatimonadaceae bacterium]|nr:hypothetical protein [Gemmatimonadaceae bacterium]
PPGIPLTTCATQDNSNRPRHSEAIPHSQLHIVGRHPARYDADVRAFRSLTHVMRGGRLYRQAALAQRE